LIRSSLGICIPSEKNSGRICKCSESDLRVKGRYYKRKLLADGIEALICLLKGLYILKGQEKSG
jgi:hypothetical protein